jgi:hypothetical protein
MHPAITAINTGTPTPMLTPMISLSLTPPVFPFSTPLIPLLVAEAVGTKDTGLPLVELMALIPVPNAIALTAVPVVAVIKVAFDPEGTTDTRVFVTVFLEVDCRETGQFMRPVDKHCVAVYVYVTSVLVVVDEAAFRAVTVAPVAAALTVPVAAHAAARVVKNSGIWVSGVGPHVCSSNANSNASVAPALAPRSKVYSSMMCSSQLVPLPAGAAVTFVTNCATPAQTPATMPALKPSEMSAMVSVDVLISRPAFMPTRRRAVRTAPEVWIVTGRNSKLPPLLKICSQPGKRSNLGEEETG